MDYQILSSIIHNKIKYFITKKVWGKYCIDLYILHTYSYKWSRKNSFLRFGPKEWIKDNLLYAPVYFNDLNEATNTLAKLRANDLAKCMKKQEQYDTTDKVEYTSEWEYSIYD